MRLRCLMCCALLSQILTVCSAAPPDKARELTAEEKKEVARLEQDFYRKLGTGEFEEALKTARQILGYRASRQGNHH